MWAECILTVQESKRLIGKGVAQHPLVRKALKEGMVAVSKGSTNAYVVEEILGKRIDKLSYLTGFTLPRKKRFSLPPPSPDLVLKKGKIREKFTVVEAVKEMGPGDVFIKGGNALDYERGLVGILIGHPTGGTIGSVLGTVVARGVHLFLPVGLEKLVTGNILETSQRLREAKAKKNPLPSLMPVKGIILTEIEALNILSGVKAYHISSGGIGGAEGSVRLLLEGEKEKLKNALSLLQSLQGEPPFM